MYVKHTLSTVLALACLLTACGSPAVTPEDQQQAVRVILNLSPDEPGDVCEVDRVECDAQGNVTKLDLSYNQMTSPPSEIGQLTHLQALILFNGQLSSLPPEIAHLTHLQELNLYNNLFTSLPTEIGQLTSLRVLEIGRAHV